LYGVLVLPTGLIVRIGGELLESKRQTETSYWQARPIRTETLRNAREQS